MPNARRAALLCDHAAINHLAAQLTQLMDSDADAPSLAFALDQLVTTVRDHLATEDATLYSLAMEAEGKRSTSEIERVRGDFEQLKLDWNAYLCGWSAAEIEADRSGFVLASRAMLPRLTQRVRLETELLLLLDMQIQAEGQDGRHGSGTPSPAAG